MIILFFFKFLLISCCLLKRVHDISNRNALSTVVQNSANETTQHTITGLSPAEIYIVAVTAIGSSGPSTTFGGVDIETSKLRKATDGFYGENILRMHTCVRTTNIMTQWLHHPFDSANDDDRKSIGKVVVFESISLKLNLILS